MTPLLNAVSTANRLGWRWLLLLLLLPAFAAHAQAPCPISVPFASGSGPPLGDPGIAQTFTPTCTGKLTTLVVQYGAAADDFRGSGEFVQWSIRDAAGTTVLASVPPTDDIYGSQTRIYDFSAANVVLTAGTQYRWDGRNTRSPGLGAILLNYSALNTNPYAGGQAFVGGTANPTRDFLGWTVNIAATVQTGTISGSPFCAGAAVSVPFTAYGTIGTGNVYTAQLSDASGSFAAPATIGTLSSTATTGTINATLPAGTASGSGYRIRVTASTAGFAAVPNTSNLTITNTPAPTGAASQSFAAGATVANLAATGTAIKWYATTSSTTALPTTTPLTNGTTYYATQTVSGCESQSRLAVTATVAAPANQPPVISNQARSVAENSANGTAVGAPVTASDPDAGQTLSYAITGGNAAGKFAINPSTGQLTVAGALDFEGISSYPLTVTVTDNAATPASSSATVTVSVTNVNEAPVAVNDALTVAEDAAATTVNVLTNDTDPDAGTTLTVTAVTQPATGGTVTLTSGVVRFTPAANFNGSTSFTYTLSDGALTSTATVAVTVTPVNDAPTATNDALTVNQTAGPTVVDVLANDTSAPDTGETLTVTAVTQPSTGIVTLTGGVVRFAPTATFAGSTSFTYTISDGNGGTATATVAVTVVDTTPPTATLASGTAASGGSSAAASFAYTVTFSESVTGFVLADVSVSNGTPTGFTGSGNSYSFSVTPTAAGAVTVSIPVNVAQDASGNGNSASTPYTITFAPVATLSAGISAQTNVSCNGGATGAATVTATGGTAPYTYQWSNGATTATITGLVAGTYNVTVTDAASRTASASATITEPAALTSSVAVTNVSCFGGSTGAINLTPAGGTAPYTFNWGGGITTEDRTGLAAGTYSVTITDANNCTLVRSVSVSQPATALSVSVSKTDATTNGGANGSATATPAGGTAPYTYQWSNSAQTATITGLTAGTYNVTVTDANGCTTSGSATVGQPAAAPQDLTISTGSTAAPVAIGAGTYNNVTITGTGVARLDGAVTVNGAFLVQGSLNTNCQALTGTGSFTLAAGATLSICDAAGITATGSTGAVRLTGTRSFSPDADYVYNGTAAQQTGNGLPAQVRNLTSINQNAPINLSQPLAIRQVLTLAGNAGAGTFGLATNGQPLTLLSDATGTALIASLNGSQIQGNVTVQRYIDGSLNAGLGYRHLAAPVSGATVASFGSGGTTPVVNSAYNTSATPGQVTPFPTVYFYDQARLASSPATTLSAFDKGWQSPADLTDAAQLSARGFTVQLPGASTLSFTGPVLDQASASILLSRASGSTAPDAGWNLVGNPFPSPLDLSTIPAGQRFNMDAAFYTYESTSQYSGGYRSYVNGIGNPLIGSSQAFFVRVNDGQTTGGLGLTNDNRVTTYNPQAPVRRGAADTRPQLQLTLSGQGLTDALTLYAQAGATTGFDREFDAAKLWNPNGLSLATLAASGQALAIDGRPALPLAQPVPLTLQAPRAGQYTLTAASLANLPAGARLTLVDLLTGTRIPLLAGTSYALTLGAGTTAGRLQLESAAAPLATAGTLAKQMGLYPNPTTDGLVQLVRPAAWGTVQVQVLNSIGQLVHSARLSAGEQTLDVQPLPVGVYTLRLSTQHGQTLTKRLVRQ